MRSRGLSLPPPKCSFRRNGNFLSSRTLGPHLQMHERRGGGTKWLLPKRQGCLRAFAIPASFTSHFATFFPLHGLTCPTPLSLLLAAHEVACRRKSGGFFFRRKSFLMQPVIPLCYKQEFWRPPNFLKFLPPHPCLRNILRI